jgi:hypothetical protein
VSIALAATFAGLFAVGLTGFRRTRRLRHGHRGPGPAVRRPVARPVAPTSRTTHLAGAGGLLVALLAVVGAPRTPPWATAVAMAWGALIAATGIAGRVAALEVRDEGLTIRYERRPPFRLPWPDLRRIRPPATPLGGWRLEGVSGSRTLMPSDLLGNEAVIETGILRAGLAFDGRCWRAPDVAARPPVGPARPPFCR